ncbi:RNA polymerase sigma factor [Streptomyces javensis]|uniref:Sigma-70 family RNA polymerase sigma factor n=1 Tax=Streptomyces javensis TaxID=114698 RepID=A0ABS0R3Y6_9ACTN|nr:sigma-70 family RNA polymerase sigma factor [Streptomyces javensis]MBI0312013.1 sigma-70 family RNA polymerase sigma factor [Streptomyces javensis]
MTLQKAVLGAADEMAGEQPSVIFESFVAGNRDYFVRWAYSRTGSMDDAREAANDAFLTIYKRWDVVLASENADAFARKILKDAVADILRKRDRRRYSLVGLAFDPSASPVNCAPDEEIDLVALRLQVYKAVEALPDQQRACVTEHYLLDTPVEQIARRMGITASTVRSHLAAARTTLAEAFGVHSEPSDEKGVNG